MIFNQQHTLNCKGKLIDCTTPKIMGILNVTPDSFFDGGNYQKKQAIREQVATMLSEGADIIDVGGMSSRPGAEMISTQEELQRVLPAIEIIKKYFSEAIVSIDTVKAEVAKQAVNNGASIVNDISAGNIDDKMFETVAQLDVPYVLMHMKGTPKDMQINPKYNKDVIDEMLDFFVEKLAKLHEFDIKDVVLDVGFGFGKSIEDNYKIMRKLTNFGFFERPLLVGVSRKSMIYKLLDCSPKEALNGTTVLHTFALQNGANILRVHDVKQAKETIKILNQINVE